MHPAVELINSIPFAGLLLVVTLGFSLSHLRLRRVTLGPAGATILVALLFGELGVQVTGAMPGETTGLPTLGQFGGLLFIYAVGYEAGPDFFDALRRGRGWRFVLVGLALPLAAAASVWCCARLLGMAPAAAAGVLAGVTTSAPSFAASSALITSTSTMMTDSRALSLAFAISYPIGLAGFAIALQVLPRMFKQDIARGTRSEHEQLEADGHTMLRPRGGTPELPRTYRATRDESLGKILRELGLTKTTGCVIAAIRRGGNVIYPHGETMLERGDVVLAVGRLDELTTFERTVGPEVYDADLSRLVHNARRVRVLQPEVCGRSLSELELVRRRHCVVVKVERGAALMEPSAELVLARDDVVDIVGATDDVRTVARALGQFKQPEVDTNIAIFAGGLLLGLLIGSARLGPPGFEISLSSFGGVLITGILLGRVRRMGRLNAAVPRPARHLVRDLGLLLFIGETGMLAGAGLQAAGGLLIAAQQELWKTLVAAAIGTILPVLAGLILARYLMRLRLVDAWGSVAGGMTSSTLPLLKLAADSNEPATSFAAAYATATLLLTVAGQAVLLLL